MNGCYFNAISQNSQLPVTFITFGLESDFIDQKTGETYLALKIAQAHYLDKKAGKNYSNLVGSGLFLFYHPLHILF
jgi:hypothetical protein